ncbi:MAG: hypothetical protein HQL32_07145 [Planctomycetes bacterium]|nr:hypothetical protein [Planctomycetota bacterium]
MISTDHYPMYALSKDKSALTYLSFNPDSLKRIQSSDSTNQILRDEVPCDLRLGVNFKNAYMLKRKFMQECVKNRVLAGWRRQNRLDRIDFLFGNPIHIGKRVSLTLIEDNNIFPKAESKYDNLIYGLPKFQGMKSRKRHGSAANAFNHLPDFVQKLKSVDAFISIESNGLFFENHIQMDIKEETQNQAGGVIMPNEQSEATLDFDEE